MSGLVGLHELRDILGNERFTKMVDAGFIVEDLLCAILYEAKGEHQRYLAKRFYYETDLHETWFVTSCHLKGAAEIPMYVGLYETDIECENCGRLIYVKSRDEFNDLIIREMNYDPDLTDEPILCRDCHPFLGRNLARWDGYVYLLESNGVYKIGKSVNVNRRLTQISPVMPYPVELLHAIRTTDHSALEAQLHEMFAPKRLNGEWFELSARDVRFIQSLKDVEI